VRSIVVYVAALCTLLAEVPTMAAALKAPALACKAPADAAKAFQLQAKKDKIGLEALTRPLIASGAYMPIGKGVTVEVDEKKLPLSCVRLTGDLSCYWIADVLVDPHPEEKSGAQGGKRGSRSH
jgi:hypothetical protein